MTTDPRETPAIDDLIETLATARAQAKSMDFVTYLDKVCGYQNIRLLPGHRWAATYRFGFTTAIIVGRFGDVQGYANRWCYKDLRSAMAALVAWDGDSEPDGWHRHPASGRRRNRETGEDYINP